jgi:predicted O-methyltransferase YrrM
VKWQVLLNHSIPNAIWIETGTYLGDTTHLLSKHAKFVYTLEPEPTLFRKAEDRFKRQLSRDRLPEQRLGQLGTYAE